MPGETAAALGKELLLVGPDGLVRTLVLGLRTPAAWPSLSVVWRGVQADLNLPAPAIAVNGVDAYELWFSLAEPVPLAQAAVFLEGLRHRYLPDAKPARVRACPSPGAQGVPQTTPLIPAAQGVSGNWAAFVAPDLAAVFGDEPVLDLAPGEDAQAELLCRLSSIRPTDFETALAVLQAAAPGVWPAQVLSVPAAPAKPVTDHQQDARQFLIGVMNDAAVPIALRIEAAKALLSC